MKTWYKSGIAKLLLIIVVILSAVVTMTSFVKCVIHVRNSGEKDIFSSSDIEYEESQLFQDQLFNTTIFVMEQIQFSQGFKTDGVYNPDALIDVVQYANNKTITGENESGLAYKAKDILEWGELYYNGKSDTEPEPIIVCKKLDGTYHYYYENEFINEILEGKLKVEGTELTNQELVDNIVVYGSHFTDVTVRDESGDILYSEFWNFYTSFQERFTPDGGNSILDILNNNPKLNGNLESILGYTEYLIRNFYDSYMLYQDVEELQEGNSNFIYIFADKDNKKIITNRKQYEDFGKLNSYIDEIQKSDHMKYVIVQKKLYDFQSNLDISATTWTNTIKEFALANDSINDFTCVVAVDTSFPIQDTYYETQMYYETQKMSDSWIVMGILGAILFTISYIWLTVVAGRTNKDEKVHLNLFDTWKTEIAAVVVVGIWIAFSLILLEGLGAAFNTYVYSGTSAVTPVFYSSSDRNNLIIVGVYTAGTMGLFLWGYLSLVRRIKAGTLWSNSLLHMLCRCWKFFWKNRSIVTKETAPILIYVLFSFFAMAVGGIMPLISLILSIVLLAKIVAEGLAKERIKKGIKEISSGELKYQISTKYLKGEYLELAEDVNKIAEGLDKAVEKSMRSERLKAELITNVSHDIKTPLTSIINYIDLLKRENIEDEKIQGYLEVLEAKAQRLKTLTEDVVEASKVSSGNITLECMNVDLVEMLHQTSGEFAEKFEQKNLQLIENFSQDTAIIHVDGRRMWRVLENLYGNVAKYALSGSRVYADLKVQEGQVIFSLKNISEQALNIASEELTERFIRGDVSRSTEGSGLGLSIAKSLVEMQGGKFEIYLDGDLFKVTIQFQEQKGQ